MGDILEALKFLSDHNGMVVSLVILIFGSVTFGWYSRDIFQRVGELEDYRNNHQVDSVAGFTRIDVLEGIAQRLEVLVSQHDTDIRILQSARLDTHGRLVAHTTEIENLKGRHR